MSSKKISALFIFFLISSIVILFLKRNSPFGLLFWLGFYLFLFTLFGLLFYMGLSLWKKKNYVSKTFAILFLSITGVALLITIIGSYDYRILLPMTTSNDLSKAEFEKDMQFFDSIVRTHPGFTKELDSLITTKSNSIYSRGYDQRREDMIREITTIIALFKDGHSFVPPFQVYNRSRYFPISGYQFNDGYYILETAQEYQSLINNKLLKINGVNIDEVLEQIDSYTGPENPYNAIARSNMFLFSASILLNLGIIENNKHCILTYKDEKGNEKNKKIKSSPFVNWAFWSYKPNQNRYPVSLHLGKPNFEVEVIDNNIILTLNQIQNISSDDNFINLAISLRNHLENKRIEKLIIDLRKNTGGNNTLYDPIIDVINDVDYINQKDKLYALTSGTTFSAAINFVDDLKWRTNCTIVGIPPGAGATHYGDANMITLPHSGIFFFLSTRQWISKDSTKTENVIDIDIPVEFNHADYLSDSDPWMKAIDRF